MAIIDKTGKVNIAPIMGCGTRTIDSERRLI